MPRASQAMPEQEVLKGCLKAARYLATRKDSDQHHRLEPAPSPRGWAPRRAPGADPVDPVLRVGALAYRLLTGRSVRPGDLLDGFDWGKGLEERVSRRTRVLLGRATAPLKGERYAGLEELTAALEGARSSLEGERPIWSRVRGAGAGRLSGKLGLPGDRPVWRSKMPAPLTQGGMAATDRTLLASTEDGSIQALDLHSGAVLWRVRPGGALRGGLCLDGPGLLAADQEGRLHRLELDTGREMKRRQPLREGCRGAPLVHQEKVVLAGEQGTVVAIQAGRVRWRVSLGVPVFGSPISTGGRIVLGADDGILRALDPEDGALLWSAELKGKIRCTPAVHGGRILVGEFSGGLHAIRRGSGTVAWSVRSRGRLFASPAVGEGLVVCASTEGTLQAFHWRDGAPAWSRDLPGPVAASPVIAGGRVWTGCDDGRPRVLDLPGGEILWEGPAGNRRLRCEVLPLGNRLILGAGSEIRGYALEGSST